jgi:hypothetical protein
MRADSQVVGRDAFFAELIGDVVENVPTELNPVGTHSAASPLSPYDPCSSFPNELIGDVVENVPTKSTPVGTRSAASPLSSYATGSPFPNELLGTLWKTSLPG